MCKPMRSWFNHKKKLQDDKRGGNMTCRSEAGTVEGAEAAAAHSVTAKIEQL